MKLAKKLISYLHRIFDKDPGAFPALQIEIIGGSFSWSIADQATVGNMPGMTSILTITPSGGSAAALSVDLGSYTIASLAAFIDSQPGYAVVRVTTSPNATLSALVLLAGSGSSLNLGGDTLQGYTSLVWAFMDAYAAELETARSQIDAMPAQMNPLTAYGSWVDENGAYYGVTRNASESDAAYGARMIATVIRPLGNNVAIAEALRVINGGLAVTVEDYPVLTNNSYGLFDVNFSASVALLDATTMAELQASVAAIINPMRMAGCFLRNLSIITPIEATGYAGGVVTSGSTVWVYPVGTS
jgi:hypothetical protein